MKSSYSQSCVVNIGLDANVLNERKIWLDSTKAIARALRKYSWEWNWFIQPRLQKITNIRNSKNIIGDNLDIRTKDSKFWID